MSDVVIHALVTEPESGFLPLPHRCDRRGKRVEKLPAETFIGRFLLYALPGGFKRIRHYGMLASCHKKARLAACRRALDVPPPDTATVETVAAFRQRVAQIDIGRCPRCEDGHLQVVGVIAPRRMAFVATGPL